MFITMKSLLLLILSLASYQVLSATNNADQLAISAQAKAFSQAFVNGDIETIMAIYSPNAKIINGNDNIENDINVIREYWTPNLKSSWQLKWHKTQSDELIIDGQLASDIGYYSGLSMNEDGRESQFGGAYVIVWRKIDGVWRIHLDMWNDIK
ncbi:YybH family protein [Colwellia hornerae]|uniref:Nuclear transport factor 2 family protein n=1 Tax=Colwellia hornerae TaxID=89402 RepID=A0A5C6Q239_9GAMM|nr:nuclear transport factor 2 family protein [Colwellia hornerae]TWX44516.1 nuclear transport factor 2 family protein [Colwellia hornerae]TWX52931.1 nuclear transport factor 2 family protein [Colwellia hornerae]TWX62023.1 nuclear transport factor 2 family protein [Colwellia hornerae]